MDMDGEKSNEKTAEPLTRRRLPSISARLLFIG